MGTDWTITDYEDESSRTEKYEWRLPANDQEHVAETTTPGALLIKPEDISLVPTKAPTESGVQHGWLEWTDESAPDPNWYIAGSTGEVLGRND
jgi:hypothetical protein